MVEYLRPRRLSQATRKVHQEHGPMDLETSEHLVRAADVAGLTPIARVAVNHPQVILRYLDMGCLGVQIPMVNSGAEATAVANACRYPPVGRRGLAGGRP